MSWDFRIGQRVVCINDEGYMTCSRRRFIFWRQEKDVHHNLARGREYSITWYGLVHCLNNGPIHFIGVAGGKWIGVEFDLSECPHPHPFPAHWFRPLQKRQTSIEVFEKILTGAPVEGDFAPAACSATFPPRAHEVHVPRRTIPS